MSDPRNVAIALLGAAVVLLMALLLAREDGGEAPPLPAAGVPPVRVLDVMLDREQRRHVDLLLDRPLGEDQVGEVLPPEIATLEPQTGGTWRWRGANVLRFRPSRRFRPATEYRLALDLPQLAGERYAPAGETDFRFTTDPFQVDRVDVQETPEPGGVRRVRLRGQLFFNYPVDAAELATRVRLLDPAAEAGEVELRLERSGERRVVPWRSVPIEKGAEPRQLELEIAGDLTSADGNLPLGARFAHPIPLGSGTRLEVRGVSTEPGEERSTLRIELSSAVRPEQAKRHLRVEPEVEYAIRAEQNLLVLSGAFRPGERYELRLTRGLVARDEAELREDWAQSVRLADLPPNVDFASQGMFLSASGARSLALETRNVAKVEVVVERVYRNNVLYLIEQGAGRVGQSRAGVGRVGRVYGDEIARKTFSVERRRNRRVENLLRLDDYVSDAEPGFYRIVAGEPSQQSWRRQQRWVLLTDLGLVARRGESDVWIWVWSFRDLAPIGGAKVQLLSEQNQLLAEGTSDARGAVRLRGLAEAFETRRPALLIAEKGGDWSFLPFGVTRVDTAGLDVSGAPRPAAGYDAYLYGGRDLYRPGETLEGVAVVRDPELGLPPDMPVVLRHRDPQGQLRGEWRLALERGVAELSHEIPAWERTGSHALELLVGDRVAGRYRFQVEEFVPDRIAVEIAPARATAGPGEELPYTVSSRYLFGPPAAGLAVESRVRLTSAPFAPAGFEAFRFDNPDRKFDARDLDSASGRLDGEGRVELAFEVPGGLEVPASLEATLTARVQEPGGRGVTARERVRVHPYPHYLGLRRTAQGYAEPGVPVEVEYVAVTPDGSETRPGALRAELFEDRWQTVMRRTSSGSWRYESKREPVLLATQQLEPGAPRGTLSFTPPQYGRFRIAVTEEASGASAQVDFYASGWGFAPWALEQPGRVELDLVSDELSAGDVAELQVRAPFPGKLLVTIERDDVLHWEVHTLEGNTASLSLPVAPGFAPNVYVTASVVRSVEALEPGAAARAFGAVPLYVEREPNRLEVAVQAPDEMRPETPLEIEVRSAPGARVTVAAVDEGILQLIAQPTPDPFGHFYRKRALGVQAYDSFALLFPDVEGAALAGGGALRDAAAQFVRTEGIRRVKPVGFWSGVLETDGSGRARAVFDVPEFQGALRVMAVAHRGRRFGASERRVRVRSPLVLLPTFPRFLSFDERVEIPVGVRNDTGADAEFRVSLSAEGPVTLEAPETTVQVKGGREALVRFGVATSQQPGELRLALAATGNRESARASAELDIRADLPAVSLVTAGAIGEATLALDAAADALRPEALEVSLRVSPVPLVQIHAKLETLLRYPYGCLEQTVSRAFPLLYIGELARELEPELFEERDPQALVAAGIARVGSLQRAGGGFSLWPGGSTPDPWASIYAAHFLVEAERAGHVVPGTLLDDALDFTAREAQTRRSPSGPALERSVYALYVLARAGRADFARLSFVRSQHEQALRPTSRALLGAAFAAGGDPQALESLLAGLEDAEEVRRQTGGNFASTTRNRALFLLALLDAAPEDPRIPRLADRLARDALRHGRWSTQETATALLALGQLFQRQQQRAPYAGEVYSNGRRVAAFGGDTAVLPDLPAGPLELRMAPGYEPGAAYYALEVRGVPTDAAFAPASDGLRLRRELLSRSGAQTGTVAQGDLLVLRLELTSEAGGLENVVVQQLLPAGLEIENPRLATTETLPWVKSDLSPAHFDVRDDRLLLFVGLPDAKTRTYHALLRAVAPGRFRLPPAQAEAMYDGAIRATGERGWIEVQARP